MTKEPGLYWLVEIVEKGWATLYLQVPPTRGRTCGFTPNVNMAYAYSHKWRAKIIAWWLTRNGIRCKAARHIWID